MDPIESFFTLLYQQFVNEGWSLLSSAPELLNVALPEFSVKYIAASFHTGERVTISGRAPQASFVSLTAYNTLGLPISSTYLTPCRPFHIVMGEDLPLPDTSGLYCIIYRIYQPLRGVDFPDIFINNIRIVPKPLLRIETTSFALTIPIQTLFAKLINLQIPTPSPFFKPSSQTTEGLFPNPYATYLIGAPSLTRVIKVQGVFYNRKPSLRFIGFMASNLSTTATDSSINWDQFPTSNYEFYVTYRKKDAEACGWKPGIPLLFWKSTNLNPVIVYREVRTVNEGIFNLMSTSWQDAEQVMGIHYPIITFF